MDIKLPMNFDQDIPSLDAYAMERWESVLHFMVGSSDKHKVISPVARQLLQLAGLMKM